MRSVVRAMAIVQAITTVSVSVAFAELAALGRRILARSAQKGAAKCHSAALQTELVRVSLNGLRMLVIAAFFGALASSTSVAAPLC